MADIEHQEKLDTLDKLSVCLYRIGISVFSVSLLGLALILIEWVKLPDATTYILLSISVASALSAANLHVYNKVVRAIIVWSAWIGILLMLSDPKQTYVWLSLGFLFVTFSGIALKESFCFKVPGLKFVPLLLATSVLAMGVHHPVIASPLIALSSVILGYLSYAKWKMPLHFDIGNKANYEI